MPITVKKLQTDKPMQIVDPPAATPAAPAKVQVAAVADDTAGSKPAKAQPSVTVKLPFRGFCQPSRQRV